MDESRLTRKMFKYKVETFEYLDNREMFVHIMKYEWTLLSKYPVKAWEKWNSKLNITG